MNKLVSILGLALLWTGGVAAQDPIYEQGFENHPDAVEVLALSASPQSIYEGQSSTLSWQLKDATSCTATDGTAQWRALVLTGSDGSFDVTTLTTAGTYLFTLTCVGPVGTPAVASTNILVEVPPQVQILTFVALPATITEEDIVTLSWTLENAVDCTASGGSAQWQALVLDGSDGSVDITDLDTAGMYEFTLTCVNVVDDQAAATSDVIVEAPPPVAILSFVVAPETITIGESVNVSWTLENAIDCTPTSGSAQWLALSLDGSDSNVEITDLDIVGVYQFGLSCEGIGGDTGEASQNVTVEVAVTNCDAPTITGQNFLWADFWLSPPGVEFPDVGLARKVQVVFSKGYFSVEFNTGDVSAWGQFNSVNNTFSSGGRLGSVSECPGDFNVPTKCRATWGTGSGIRWATDGEPNSCVLAPNTTYFLNMTYTDGTNPNSSSCVPAGGLSACYITVDYAKGR